MAIRAMPLILARVPAARYVIVGDGPRRSYLERLAVALGVAGAVRFVGEIADEEVDRWYRRCDVFLLPAREDRATGGAEGYGIVCVEAGLRGKPVVAGRSGGIPDAVIDGETGRPRRPARPCRRSPTRSRGCSPSRIWPPGSVGGGQRRAQRGAGVAALHRSSSPGCSPRSPPGDRTAARPLSEPHRPARGGRAQPARSGRGARPEPRRAATAVSGRGPAARRRDPTRRRGRARGRPGRVRAHEPAGRSHRCRPAAGGRRAGGADLRGGPARRSPGTADAGAQQRQQDAPALRPAGSRRCSAGVARARLPARSRAGAHARAPGRPVRGRGDRQLGGRGRAPRAPGGAPRPGARHPQRDRPRAVHRRRSAGRSTSGVRLAAGDARGRDGRRAGALEGAGGLPASGGRAGRAPAGPALRRRGRGALHHARAWRLRAASAGPRPRAGAGRHARLRGAARGCARDPARRWTSSSTPRSSRSRSGGSSPRPWRASGRSCGRGAAAPTRSSVPAGWRPWACAAATSAGLAAAIERALLEPERVRGWAVEARRRVVERFDVRDHVARVQELYTQVAGRHP